MLEPGLSGGKGGLLCHPARKQIGPIRYLLWPIRGRVLPLTYSFTFSTAHEVHTSNANIFVTINCLFICPRVDVWYGLKIPTTTGKAPEYTQNIFTLTILQYTLKFHHMYVT